MTAPAWPMRPGLVLFDLDGTLVDSVHDLAAAANATLETLARPALPPERIRTYVGNGIERLLHRCLTGDMHADAPPALFERARDAFLAHYSVENGRHSRVYAGVREGLEAARNSGALLGCVTNKSARFSEPLLAHLGLLEPFRLVVSGDTTRHRKPHPEPLLHAARTLGVAAGATLMVGDSRNDVYAARAAGMPVICVTYGYNHGEDIAVSEPDAVLDDLSGLGELLAHR